jgi:hypothetical protein
MALLFLDSFDHIVSYIKWTSSVSGNSYQYEKKTGRTGYGAGTTSVLYYYPEGSYSWAETSSVMSTICLGAAVNLQDVTYLAMIIGNPLCTDISVNREANVFAYGLDDGRVQILLSSGGWYGGRKFVTMPCLTQNEWIYVELWARIYSVDIGGGKQAVCVDVAFRANEEMLLSDTIQGPSKTGSPFLPGRAGFTHAGITAGTSGVIDDVYITDGAMLGDIRVYTFRPSAAGDEAEWSATGATDLWQAVRNPDYEGGSTLSTSYATAAPGDVGKSFLVNMSDLTPSGRILGTQMNYVARKSGSADAAFSPRYKINGTTYNSSRVFRPSYSAWRCYVDPMAINPVTGSGWTFDDIASLQAGARRTV